MRWTERDRIQLRRLLTAGIDVDEVAAQLGRTARSVKLQVARLKTADSVTTQVCRSCGEEVPLDQCVIDKRSTTGRGSICRVCKAEQQRVYRRKRAEYFERIRKIVERGE